MKALADLLRSFRMALSGAAAKVPPAMSRVSTPVIGHWQWQPPAWLAWTGRRIATARRYLAADYRRAGAAAVLVAAAIGGWIWYRSRPVPHYVAYSVAAPGL